MMRSYKELRMIDNFKDRYLYLRLSGRVGEMSFGWDRYLNQELYNSREWKRVRDEIIIRDNACDLGIEGYEIFDKIIVHHINPITLEDIENRSPCLFDPNNLICVSNRTHNAIHYGDFDLTPQVPIVRSPRDTCLWKKGGLKND